MNLVTFFSLRYLGRWSSLEAAKHHLPANRLEPRNDPNNDKNTSRESGVARVGPINNKAKLKVEDEHC